MKKFLIIFSILTFTACDFTITLPSSSNVNTNTNTVNIHDLVNFVPTFPPTGGGTPTNPGGPDVPLPIPSSAESIARAVASANAGLIASSCQATNGPSAWAFMDLEVNTLKASDARWGYVSRNSCSTPSQDSIGYRATSDNTGLWAVDIIGGHCGGNPVFTWNVVGFDANAVWCAVR